MRDSTIEWLLRNSCPVIRFRTIVDILQAQDVSLVATSIDNLHSEPIVKLWLKRLQKRFDINEVWSNQPTSFGNVVGKLVDLGLRAGLQPFDTYTLPARSWLTDTIEALENFRLSKTMLIVASHLSLAGYSEIHYVDKILRWRLEQLHRRLVETNETSKQSVSPSWFDIVGLLQSKPIMRNPDMRQKVEDIMKLVTEERTKIRLPPPEIRPETIALMNILSLSQTIRTSNWFKSLISAIESCKTDHGTYMFPETALQEKKTGTWMTGSYLSLERKINPNTIETNSTFRVLILNKTLRTAP